MGDDRSAIHDVVICGGGPVGLFLACELRLFGVSVLVLERADDPRSPLKRLPFGLRGLSVATVETLERRGLLEAVVAARRADEAAGRMSAVSPWLRQARKPAGHFAGIQFFQDDVDASQWAYRLSRPDEAGMPVALETFEAVLAEQAIAAGAEIRRGVEVEAVHATGDGVMVRAGDETVHARWLVGCDGGRSTVRKSCGFPFEGTEPEFTGYSVEVTFAEPCDLRPGRHYTPTGLYTFAPPGTVTAVEFDGGACHRMNPITREHVQAVLRRVIGGSVTLTDLRVATTWTDRAFQATAYRDDRVLLAGDAAHVHSPLGGQGLNLGLGDASNLGWKLAATIRGDAPDGLLDTYHLERHPVGARILDWSRAQVALMRPTPGTRALEPIIRDLVATRDGATYFAERISGVALRYDLGGAHPLVGRAMPGFQRADGSRIGLPPGGEGLLLDFGASPSLSDIARRWPNHIVYSAGEVEDGMGLRALLVRPDGIVAWATDVAADDCGLDDQGATRAATQWFGPPRA